MGKSRKKKKKEVLTHIKYQMTISFRNLSYPFPHQVSDEKKRKAEVKHIQLRKRKALADLFRQLTAMGECVYATPIYSPYLTIEYSLPLYCR